MKRRKSFSARLSLNIVSLTSVLFIGAILVASLFSYRFIAEEATKGAEHLRDESILRIEKVLQEAEMTVKSTAWIASERIDDQEFLYHLTKKIVEENPNVVGSAIAFEPYYFNGQYFFSPYSFVDPATGEVASKQLGTKDYDYFSMEWYQIPKLLGEACWSEPYFDDGGGEQLMSTYSFPIKDKDGKLVAIITADISLGWLDSIISKIHPYESSKVFLVSRCGAYLNLGEGSGLQGETVFSPQGMLADKESKFYRMAKSMVDGETGSMSYLIGSKSSFAVYGPVSNGWKLAITSDFSDVLEKAMFMQFVLLLVALLGLAIMFVLIYFTVRRLTRPLAVFSRSAMSIAGGNFNTPLPVIKNEDEIAQLRNSFDYMQHSMNSYIQNLKIQTAANERFESELNIANHIQMAMLPRNFPDNEKFGLHALLTPAKEVGGDLYDFFVKDNRYLYFAVGDVSGKGVPASMFMAITRAAFHFIANMGLPLNEVVSKVNDAICDGNDSGMFVTFFAGKIDLETGDFEYCNAGHNPIVVDGEFLAVKPNIAVGLFEGFNYQVQTGKLKNDSSLILYTDGVTEAERRDKEQYGEGRLLDIAKRYMQEPPQETCNALYNDIEEFVAGNEPNDDITIMTIKLKLK